MERQRSRQYRFGVFEVNPDAGELRRQGLRIRLHPQPFQILCLLLERQGEVLTREEICSRLWPEGTFVDCEHSVNAAVNRLREALRDKANGPRYVETLPRRGYRFLGSVQIVEAQGAQASTEPLATGQEGAASGTTVLTAAPSGLAVPASSGRRWLARPEDLPQAPYRLTLTLFLLLQLMYLAFYVGALANLEEVRQLIAVLPGDGVLFASIYSLAAVLIPVRLFLLCAALFRAPRRRERFFKLWPLLLAMDMLWALSPLLLLNHLSYGLALALVPPLVYAPFAQRSLVLMGALGSDDCD